LTYMTINAELTQSPSFCLARNFAFGRQPNLKPHQSYVTVELCDSHIAQDLNDENQIDHHQHDPETRKDMVRQR